jgi:phospholipid transport system transporter-binding protein
LEYDAQRTGCEEQAVTQAHITLDAGCTLREAGELHAMLRAVECDGESIIVDGGQVERVDTAGLQLLVAFSKQQGMVGRSLTWSALSEVLIRHSRRLGVDGVLGIPATWASEAQQS